MKSNFYFFTCYSLSYFISIHPIFFLWFKAQKVWKSFSRQSVPNGWHKVGSFVKLLLIFFMYFYHVPRGVLLLVPSWFDLICGYVLKPWVIWHYSKSIVLLLYKHNSLHPSLGVQNTLNALTPRLKDFHTLLMDPPAVSISLWTLFSIGWGIFVYIQLDQTREVNYVREMN